MVRELQDAILLRMRTLATSSHRLHLKQMRTPLRQRRLQIRSHHSRLREHRLQGRRSQLRWYCRFLRPETPQQHLDVVELQFHHLNF